VKIECAYDAIVPLENLKTHPKNRNKHPDKQIKALAKIIKVNGIRSPIVVSNLSGYIVKGHGRLLALTILKVSDAPVDYQDYESEEAEMRDRTADNEIARYSEFDQAGFIEDLKEFKIEDIDYEEFGLLDFELPPELKVGMCDEDEAPPVPEVPRTVKGDLYELGDHRLLCGDSTILNDIEKLVNGSLVDQLITDPPYNVNYEGKTKDKLKIQNDKKDNESFRQFLSDCMVNAQTVMKRGAVFYIWHADSEGYNFRGACNDAQLKVRQCLIWVKNSIVMGRQDYHWKHEPCLYGWKEGAGHLWASDRKQSTVLSFNRPTRSELHPTMKPVELIEYQILNNTKGNDIVLDLFLGSGTTLIAAEKNGRKCYGMELDEHYCDVIVSRYVKYSGNNKIKLNGNDITWEIN